MARVLAALADAVFPRFCVSCKREGVVLCQTCDASWHPELPMAYADPVARQLLTAWKYHYDANAWETLRRKLSSSLSGLHLKVSVAAIEAIVPVVLNYKRSNERGFDQAKEIAYWLSSGIHLPVVPLLHRNLTFGHQADRTTTERQAAMAQSPFTVIPSVAKGALPAHVLLVDDVWTTGATMQAAATPLQELGITVDFFTLVRG